METQEVHRGRLIDHIQLVVRDLPASQKFYNAIFDVLTIPIGGRATASSGSTSCSFPRATAMPRRAH